MNPSHATPLYQQWHRHNCCQLPTFTCCMPAAGGITNYTQTQWHAPGPLLSGEPANCTSTHTRACANRQPSLAVRTWVCSHTPQRPTHRASRTRLHRPTAALAWCASAAAQHDPGPPALAPRRSCLGRPMVGAAQPRGPISNRPTAPSYHPPFCKLPSTLHQST